MSASTQDKITDTRNAARPNSTTVSSPRSIGGSSLSCASLSGWPTASKVHFVTYKIDSSSNIISGTQLDCYGIVSGNNITSFTVVDGTDAGHAIGDKVEMLPTSAWGQDLADALSVGHTRTGAHIPSLPLTSPILTTPVIADHSNANHTHASTAQGGQLGFGALLSTIFSGQVQTQANAGGGLGTLYWLNLGGVKIMWGVSSTQTVNTNTSFVFTLPAFFTTVQTCLPGAIVITGSNVAYSNVAVAPTTSSVTVNIQSTVSLTCQAHFLMIGT